MDSARATSRRRTRTGCMTCRARKIKCDEASETTCRNCARANLDCIRSDNTSLHQSARSALMMRARVSQQLTQAGLQRRRTKRSCTTCRVTKKRCGGEQPHCIRCTERELDCVYDETESEATGVASLVSPLPAPVVVALPPPLSTSPVSTWTSPSTASPSDRVELTDTLIRKLSDAFFKEVAPLRCYNFLHRHTYLEDLASLSHSPGDDSLVLAVCALGTKTIAHADLWDAGSLWARDAQLLVFSEIHDISVRRLMCIVLLYEHATRIDEQRLCFLLSGLASRFTQALSLNLEYDHDVLHTTPVMTAVERESRRRLMWACYIMDTMVACGLPDLQAIDSSTLRIQLPCDDRHFKYKIACKTATFQTNFLLPVDQRHRDRPAAHIANENQGPEAFLVRLYLVRDHILQYINSSTDKEDPWRGVSLIADLDYWKESLPPELQFNSNVIAIRKDESTLAALVSLHVQYHQVNCLLYRCMIPSMLFPARLQTGLSVKASPEFLAESRKSWFGHACAISSIFEVALQHQPGSLADHSIAGSAYNAIIIKWLYLTNFVSVEERPAQLKIMLPLVDIDLQLLQVIRCYHNCIQRTADMAERLVVDAKQRIAANPAVRLSETGNPHAYARLGLSLGRIAPDFRMNRLSAVAQMRKKIPEMHAPDPGPASPEDNHVWAGEKERLWTWSN